MRIVLVSQEYPPETAHGGIATQTYLKAHGLASLGHEVLVISHAIDHKRSEYRDGDVSVTRIPGFEDRFSIGTEAARWVTYSVAVAEEMSRLNAKSPIQIIDFPEWACESYIHLLNRQEWNHIPTVIQLHGPLVMFAHTMGWPEIDSELYRVGTAMEGTCLRLADAVFSSSSCSANWCAAHYGLDRDEIPILHTGIDCELFRPVDVPKAKRPTIIFVGKLERNKGIAILLEASLQLTKDFPDLQVRILGSGNPVLIGELRAQAIAAGAPDLLDLQGFVGREDLPAQLSSAHVFAAPSEYEGGPGFVYLEAMACGLPVIACEGNGASEVITNAKHGYLVPPKNSDALVTALRELLSDRRKREEMGGNGRLYVREKANTKDRIRKLEAFYSSVACCSLAASARTSA